MHLKRAARQWEGKNNSLKDIEGVDTCDIFLKPIYSTFNMIFLGGTGNCDIYGLL
jgi:hypothetical protein